MAAHFREAFLLSLWFKSSSSLTLRFAKCRYQRGKALGYLDRAKRCGLSLCLSGCYSAPNTTDYVASSPCNERDLTLMQVLFSWTLFPREREKKWHLGTRSDAWNRVFFYLSSMLLRVRKTRFQDRYAEQKKGPPMLCPLPSSICMEIWDNWSLPVFPKSFLVSSSCYDMQLLRIAYVRFVANSFPHTRRNFYYFCIILENERLNFYLLHLII